MSFWPEVVENTEKTDSNEIRSTAEGIREATGWECPVDKNSVYALCQLHEVYVDEKRRRTDDAAGPSKTPESWNSEGKGKGKIIPAFKLSSGIKQRTDLKKVLEERILGSWVEFSLLAPVPPRTSKKQKNNSRTILLRRTESTADTT